MDKVRIGTVGLGLRGNGMTVGNIAKNKNVVISAVCDVYEDRVQSCIESLTKKGFAAPFGTTDHRKMLSKELVDAVYVATSWETHVSVAIDFLKAGIPVALEVGGSQDIKELWELVETQEKTKTPFMFMENCCYGKNELLGTAMARKGLFGEIVQCSGAYAHDLRDEISTGKEERHYRLNHYINENCDNYPTHELGPIAKLLNINRGNRMVSLVSIASKAAGLHEYVMSYPDKVPNRELEKVTFKQGDIVDTIITCENGETIRLCLDTTLPRSYDRQFTVRGTKGYYSQSYNTVYFDGGAHYKNIEERKADIDNATQYEKEYLPEMWAKITKEEIEAGHGGMDVFTVRAFVNAVKNGTEMPIDVYDAAAWMCVTALSAESIKKGGAPMQIPDFTRGKYKTRKPQDVVPL